MLVKRMETNDTISKYLCFKTHYVFSDIDFKLFNFQLLLNSQKKGFLITTVASCGHQLGIDS